MTEVTFIYRLDLLRLPDPVYTDSTHRAQEVPYSPCLMSQLFPLPTVAELGFIYD